MSEEKLARKVFYRVSDQGDMMSAEYERQICHDYGFVVWKMVLEEKEGFPPFFPVNDGGKAWGVAESPEQAKTMAIDRFRRLAVELAYLGQSKMDEASLYIHRAQALLISDDSKKENQQ